MRKLFLTLAIILAVCAYWYISGITRYSKDVYLPQKVLDISGPLNGTIDVDLLNSLNPAYE